MGLDMYLNKRIYIGAEYSHRKIKGAIEIIREEKNEPIIINFNKISEIIESVGSWRKANQIHRWFVDNVQNSEDDCGEHWVSLEQLKELKLNCEMVLKDHSLCQKLLPTQIGFFFGSEDYDEFYFDNLELTIKIINEAIASNKKQSGEFYYSSSW